MHQDVIASDFARHLFEWHRIRVIGVELCTNFLEDVAPFVRLSLCADCGRRHVEGSIYQKHVSRSCDANKGPARGPPDSK